MLLLVNTFQKDLKSSNPIEAGLALNAICKLVNLDLMPAVAPAVISVIQHRHVSVRQKTCMALLKFYQLDGQDDAYVENAITDTSWLLVSAKLYSRGYIGFGYFLVIRFWSFLNR